MTTLQAFSPDGVLLPVGGAWTFLVETRDANGYRSSAVAPTIAVTLPDGTAGVAPTFTNPYTGGWTATYTVLPPGRYLAHVATPEDALDFAAYAAGPTTAAGMPNVSDVANYLRSAAASWSTADLQEELDGEAAAQRSRCKIRAVYPDDLRKALFRRVQRALAMRALPLAVLQGDAEGGASILPGSDPEVRRLEGPHRKRTVG